LSTRRRRKQIEEILSHADVRIDGERPWDIQVLDDRLYAKIMRKGSLGLGESYMDRWWRVERLDEFMYRILVAGLDRSTPGVQHGLLALGKRLVNAQKRARAFEVGKRHYDLGDDLFRAMLDKQMTYFWAYWEDAGNLDEAQEAKLRLVCRKLGLTTGMRVLDIGCGWGSFARYAAERYGSSVVGITVSARQANAARQVCRALPVEIRLADYRDIHEQFDRIVSIGMFEHVGYKNYRMFMEMVASSLKPGGLFLLHTIGGNISVHCTDPWIEKYIFPNSMLPSIAQIGRAIEGLFVMEDWENLGTHYDRTLMAWFHNFQEHWPLLRAMYDNRFCRMWEYYLLSSAASFRARRNQVWQIVLTPQGVRTPYRRDRASTTREHFKEPRRVPHLV